MNNKSFHRKLWLLNTFFHQYLRIFENLVIFGNTFFQKLRLRSHEILPKFLGQCPHYTKCHKYQKINLLDVYCSNEMSSIWVTIRLLPNCTSILLTGPGSADRSTGIVNSVSLMRVTI